MTALLKHCSRLTLAAVVATMAWAPAPAQDLPAEPPVRSWQRGFLAVELQALLQDQTVAFYLARGFPAAVAADFARRGCVFRATIGSVAEGHDDPVIDLDLKSWKVQAGGAAQSFPIQADWDTEWKRTGVAESARIAFRWALFPPRQSFSAGDHNWGMMTFGLPPGSRFDLLLRWREDGAERAGRIDGLECAPDGL